MAADDQVRDLLVQWEERHEQGNPVSAEDLCRDCPDLLEELKRQIRALQAMDWMARPAGKAEDADAAFQENAAAHPLAGQEISAGLRFCVVKAHAKGGLGEVFLASDMALHRDVAVKQIQEFHANDPKSRSRFLLEAEITGGLEHPGVVPIYGLGKYADGRPFYAMRFIHGESLKTAIERFHQSEGVAQKPGERSLALRQLLGRFIAVCNTIAYAHSRGIMHRDIKPANIMLGKYGETLVVDWGLARVFQQEDRAGSLGEEALLSGLGGGSSETPAGALVGTPVYCSPEQLAGQWDVVGPASDIFSLGATLYNLLTNRTPYNGRSGLEIIDQASKGEVIPPRQRKKDVPRPLEAICLKAMACKQEERYGSALDLAADVEHWLADEPVAAYRDPWPARLGRWARQHRPLVAGALVLLATAVAGLVVGIVAVNQERQRTEAARSQEALRRVQAREAFEAMSSQVIDEWLSKEKELLPEHRAFLEKALTFYEEFARDIGPDEETRAGVAAANRQVGYIYWRLGQAAEAEAAYRRSVDLHGLLAADFPSRPEFRQDLAKSRNNLGLLLKDTGRPQEAEAVYRDALTLQKQLVADFPNRPDFRSELATSHINLGVLLAETGCPQLAEVEYRDAVAMQKQLVADLPSRPDFRLVLSRSYNNLANLLTITGRGLPAEAAYRDALALQNRLIIDFPSLPDFRSELAASHNNLGSLLANTGRPQQAEASYRNALTLYKQLAADFPSRPEFRQDLAMSHCNLGLILGAAGNPQEAEAVYRDAVTLQKQLVADFPNRPDFHVALAKSYNNLGDLLTITGRLKPADAAYRGALTLLKQLAADFPAVPDYQFELANTLDGLAGIAHAQHHDIDACRLLDQARPLILQALQANPRHPFYRHIARTNRQSLAQARLRLGEHATAAAAAEEMLPVCTNPAIGSYNAACILAQCVPLAEQDNRLPVAKRKEAAQDYANRAMAGLRQAVDKGFKDAANMKKDKDLDPLRARADFQQLLADLDKKASPSAK
jgi:serine/threonine-protein kinase